MLSLPNDGRYPTLQLTPEQRRQGMLEALGAQLKALTNKNPVLMIFEDAHWTDPTSLEAFGRAVNRVVTLPVMLIVTFRPEFDAPWIGRPRDRALLSIGWKSAKSPSSSTAFLATSACRQTSPDIIERTDGIPLFVEEITKAVLEAESHGAAERTLAAIPFSALEVPASCTRRSWRG